MISLGEYFHRLQKDGKKIQVRVTIGDPVCGTIETIGQDFLVLRMGSAGKALIPIQAIGLIAIPTTED